MKIGLLGDFSSLPAVNWLIAAGHELQPLKLDLHDGAMTVERLLLNLAASPNQCISLRRIREAVGPSLPIVVILPDNDEERVVVALKTGADDCVAVPLRQEEFLARVALPNRWKLRPVTGKLLVVNSFTLDPYERTLHRDGVAIALTPKDFQVALVLLSNLGSMLSRKYIASTVWGERSIETSRTIDTHVSRVKKRLGLTEEQGWRLEVVYGKGYRLSKVDPRSARMVSDLDAMSGVLLSGSAQGEGIRRQRKR